MSYGDGPADALTEPGDVVEQRGAQRRDVRRLVHDRHDLIPVTHSGVGERGHVPDRRPDVGDERVRVLRSSCRVLEHLRRLRPGPGERTVGALEDLLEVVTAVVRQGLQEVRRRAGDLGDALGREGVVDSDASALDERGSARIIADEFQIAVCEEGFGPRDRFDVGRVLPSRLEREGDARVGAAALDLLDLADRDAHLGDPVAHIQTDRVRDVGTEAVTTRHVRTDIACGGHAQPDGRDHRGHRRDRSDPAGGPPPRAGAPP